VFVPHQTTAYCHWTVHLVKSVSCITIPEYLRLVLKKFVSFYGGVIQSLNRPRVIYCRATWSVFAEKNGAEQPLQYMYRLQWYPAASGTSNRDYLNLVWFAARWPSLHWSRTSCLAEALCCFPSCSCHLKRHLISLLTGLQAAAFSTDPFNLVSQLCSCQFPFSQTSLQ